jgi:hypothetical protein
MTCECVVHFVCNADHITSVCGDGGELLLGFLFKQGFQESASTPLLSYAFSVPLLAYTIQYVCVAAARLGSSEEVRESG